MSQNPGMTVVTAGYFGFRSWRAQIFEPWSAASERRNASANALYLVAMFYAPVARRQRAQIGGGSGVHFQQRSQREPRASDTVIGVSQVSGSRCTSETM